jgi:hypothetical protein
MSGSSAEMSISRRITLVHYPTTECFSVPCIPQVFREFDKDRDMVMFVLMAENTVKKLRRKVRHGNFNRGTIGSKRSTEN